MRTDREILGNLNGTAPVSMKVINIRKTNFLVTYQALRVNSKKVLTAKFQFYFAFLNPAEKKLRLFCLGFQNRTF